MRPFKKNSIGTAGLLLFGCAFLLCSPLPAEEVVSATPFAGYLTCTLANGSNPLIGADLALRCVFERGKAPKEYYEGLTGIVLGSGQRSQTVVFQVVMSRPNAIAALAGDYNWRGLSQAQSVSLVGADGSDVILSPVTSSGATDLAALNALLGLSQLHLNYAGRTR